MTHNVVLNVGVAISLYHTIKLNPSFSSPLEQYNAKLNLCNYRCYFPFFLLQALPRITLCIVTPIISIKIRGLIKDGMILKAEQAIKIWEVQIGIFK